MSTGQTLRRIRDNYDRYLDRRFDRRDSDPSPLHEVVFHGGGTVETNLATPEWECLAFFDRSLPAFHEFSYQSLLHLPSQLVRSVQIQVTPDHRHYWAWTAEVLSQVSSSVDGVDRNLKQYVLLLVDIAVASLTPAPVHDRSHTFDSGISPHLFRAVTFSHRAATLMSYPVLEGLTRRLCSADVALDGVVKADKRVSRIDGGVFRPGDRCNHFSHLLYHFEKNIADDETAAELASFRSGVKELVSADHAYLALQNWRNPNAHGGERFSGAEYAVVLTLICLLIWSRIEAHAYQSLDRGPYATAVESARESEGSDLFGYYPLEETGALLSYI